MKASYKIARSISQIKNQIDRLLTGPGGPSGYEAESIGGRRRRDRAIRLALSRRAGRSTRWLNAFLAIALLVGQVSPAVASTLGPDVENAVEATAKGAASTIARDVKSGLSSWSWLTGKKNGAGPRRPQDQNSLMTQLKLCPTQFTMYVGEELVLTAVPLDGTGNPVNGVIPTYSTSDQGVATVSNLGTVTALAPG
ncbi:MAG: hypothetical protein ACREDR_37615, partial [Blastocatellia bacterium]